jgi:hypothetical protein
MPDQFKKTPAGMVVSFMYFKVFGKISNPFTEKSDLNLWRAGVPFMALELLDDLFSLFLSERHEIPPFPLNVTSVGECSWG